MATKVERQRAFAKAHPEFAAGEKAAHKASQARAEKYVADKKRKTEQRRQTRTFSPTFSTGGGAGMGTQDPQKGSPAWARIQAANLAKQQAAQQRAYTTPGHRLYRGREEGVFSQDIKPFMEAMEKTQERAATDRATALAEIRSGKAAGLGALDPWQQRISALEAEPGMTEGQESQMFEESRTGIEAGAQAQMREMGGAFAPGGFRQAQVGGVLAGRTGQLAKARRDIGFKKMGMKREGMMEALRQRGLFGQAAAGLETGASKSLASIYGRTISAVPQLQYG